MYIGNRPITALVDSGATHSCVNSEVLDLLAGSVEELKLEDAQVVLRTAGKQRLHVCGSASLPLRFSKNGPLLGSRNLRFVVVKNLGPDLILGVDFLSASSARVDFGTHKMSLSQGLRYDGTKRIDVRLLENTSRESKEKVAAIEAYEKYALV